MLSRRDNKRYNTDITCYIACYLGVISVLSRCYLGVISVLSRCYLCVISVLSRVICVRECVCVCVCVCLESCLSQTAAVACMYMRSSHSIIAIGIATIYSDRYRCCCFCSCSIFYDAYGCLLRGRLPFVSGLAYRQTVCVPGNKVEPQLRVWLPRSRPL